MSKETDLRRWIRLPKDGLDRFHDGRPRNNISAPAVGYPKSSMVTCYGAGNFKRLGERNDVLR